MFGSVWIQYDYFFFKPIGLIYPAIVDCSGFTILGVVELSLTSYGLIETVSCYVSSYCSFLVKSPDTMLLVSCLLGGTSSQIFGCIFVLLK